MNESRKNEVKREIDWSILLKKYNASSGVFFSDGRPCLTMYIYGAVMFPNHFLATSPWWYLYTITRRVSSVYVHIWTYNNNYCCVQTFQIVCRRKRRAEKKNSSLRGSTVIIILCWWWLPGLDAAAPCVWRLRRYYHVAGPRWNHRLSV